MDNPLISFKHCWIQQSYFIQQYRFLSINCKHMVGKFINHWFKRVTLKSTSMSSRSWSISRPKLICLENHTPNLFLMKSLAIMFTIKESGCHKKVMFGGTLEAVILLIWGISIKLWVGWLRKNVVDEKTFLSSC